MRGALNMQARWVNQMILNSQNGNSELPDPEIGAAQTGQRARPILTGDTPPTTPPAERARVLRSPHQRAKASARPQTGSPKPGKEADIIILDAEETTSHRQPRPGAVGYR